MAGLYNSFALAGYVAKVSNVQSSDDWSISALRFLASKTSLNECFL